MIQFQKFAVDAERGLDSSEPDLGRYRQQPTDSARVLGRRYEEDVVKVLHYVCTTETGRALMEAIQTGRTIDSEPPYGDLPTPSISPQPGHHAVTSSSRDGSIRYTPALYWDRSRPAEAADEVLVHEMVHTSRRTTGAPDRPGVGTYNSEDEIYAVLICNYYCQQRSRLMRRDYGLQRLPLRVSDTTWLGQSPGGPHDHAFYVRRLIQQQDLLCTRLGGLPVDFNPIARVR